MNIVVLERCDWQDQQHVRLVDRRADHIRSVLRAAVGDSVRVGELNGQLGQATFVRLDKEELELTYILDTLPP